MENIIGKNLDFTLTGDSFEDLKYKSERSCYELSDIRIAENDGRIIIDETTNGVGGYIPYKKGQIIGIIRNWEREYIKRPIVFDSPELLAVILEIKEQVAAYKEEQLRKEKSCECEAPNSNSKRV
ncbi:MAG: hypothetical protein [Bacteriophage sp.]|nr:MAG: hypothetical protein [Bacteriophage sp.]